MKTTLPKNLVKGYIEQIENLYWLFSKLDKPPINGSGLHVTMPLNKQGVRKLLSSTSSMNKGELKIVKRPENLPFLGEVVRLDAYVITLSNAKMVSEASKLQEQLIKDKESITVEWIGTAESQLSVRNISHDNKGSL